MQKWDAEKVRKVLEGTAVVRVVDVEPPTPKMQQKEPQTSKCRSGARADSCSAALHDVLEESMRSLSLGKK